MKRLPIAFACFLPALAALCATALAQHGTRLSTPEWTEFRVVARRYDSLQAVFKKMQEDQPELKRNPLLMQSRLQNGLQEITAIYQAVPSKAQPAMASVQSLDGYGLEDLRLIKLAAISLNDIPKAQGANERLAALLRDPDSIRQVKRELAQLSALQGELDKAAALATDENLSDASEMEKAQLYGSIATGAADDGRLDQAKDYAARTVKALRSYQLQDLDAPGMPADSMQRAELKKMQDYYFTSQLSDVVGAVAWLCKSTGGTAAKDAFLAAMRGLVGDSALWAQTTAGIDATMQKLDGERKTLNQPAPAWAAHEWIGTTPLTLEGLAGKVVLVDFFATWCKPCIMAFPHLRDWTERYAGQGLVVVGLTNSQGRYDGKQLGADEEFAKLKDDFIPKHKINWAVGVEKSGRKTFTEYGVNGIPHVVLIDRKGVLRYFKVGAADYDKTEKMIKKLLAEK